MSDQVNIKQAQAGDLFLFIDHEDDDNDGSGFGITEVLVFIRQRDNRYIYTDIIALRNLPVVPVFGHETVFEKRITPLDFPLYLNYRKKTDTFDQILRGEKPEDLIISLPTDKGELFKFQEAYQNKTLLQIIYLRD